VGIFTTERDNEYVPRKKLEVGMDKEGSFSKISTFPEPSVQGFPECEEGEEGEGRKEGRNKVQARNLKEKKKEEEEENRLSGSMQVQVKL